MNSPEKLETEKNREAPAENAVELKDEEFYKGAEILENPPDDSFTLGLQTFVAWVKSLID
ncbi:MAG: hypothetical protein ABI643_00205 [Candidatus Doudnabacteria bacterium]